jgi:DNA-binding transcriptional LysR family regulator
MDRIDSWRLFASVATERSFSKAARRERRSPQAVTRAVAALEARVGTRLLNRTTRSVSLTDDGARYLEKCRRVLAEFDQLDTAAGASQTEPRGVLSVTAPVLFGQLHILPIVEEFLELHRAMDVRLVLLDRVVSLAEEGIDLGIRIGSLPDSSLRARQVGRTRSVVCASPDYLKRRGIPRDLQALSRHDGIAFSATTPVADRWSFLQPSRRERSVFVHPRLIVNTGQAAIDAALAGLGLVRVFAYQIDHLVAQKQLRIVLESFEPEPIPIQLVQLPGVQVRAATKFAELAASRLTARFGGAPRTLR